MRLKVFLLSFVLSLPFWWGANVFEKELQSFFFYNEIGYNSDVLLAQVSLPIKTADRPLVRKKPGAENIEIEAKSAYSLLITEKGEEQVLFKKNEEEKLPIASLSKLMTALVVLENYDLSTRITISQAAVDQAEKLGKLKAGMKVPTGYLLYPLLMESSNDAAYSLANDYPDMTKDVFVALMNNASGRLNLTNTYFINNSGLDPKEPEYEINYSTASDLATLTRDLLNQPVIWEILATPSYNAFGPELYNTNELLSETNGWRDKIIGGKTGFTPKAGGCIILALKSPNNDNDVIINVILGAESLEKRFLEMRKLINWIYDSYQW